MADLAILGQDPGFAGGIMAQTVALWEAAESFGRNPELHYLRYRRLDGARPTARLAGTAVQPVVRDLDALNVLVAARRLAGRVQTIPALFVCTAAASAGYGAVLSRRRYACWISTTLAEEDEARQHALTGPRRLAHMANSPLLRRFERATIRGAAVRWTISPASRRALAAASGVPEETIRVVPIPVDTSTFTPLDDRAWDRGLETPRLVFVGRGDDPRKNLSLLLDAFGHLRERMPSVSLTLVGTPPAGRLPPGVMATGVVPSVAEVMRTGALFVLPSFQEGFGIVVAEALACGVPVLVTPSGGPEDLVHASGAGEVTDGFDAIELSDRAFALLSDRARLHEMRRRGREHAVAEHGPERLRAALAEALEEIDLR